MSSDIIQVRVSSEMKKQAEFLFASIGLKTGEAIRVFLQQSINSGGLPFQPHLKTPNAETLRALSDGETGAVTPTTLKDLRREMGLDAP